MFPGAAPPQITSHDPSIGCKMKCGAPERTPSPPQELKMHGFSRNIDFFCLRKKKERKNGLAGTENDFFLLSKDADGVISPDSFCRVHKMKLEPSYLEENIPKPAYSTCIAVRRCHYPFQSDNNAATPTPGIQTCSPEQPPHK